MLPFSCQICSEFANSVKSNLRLICSQKDRLTLITDFFSQGNQAKNLKLFRMTGALLMLEALRLLMVRSLRDSCPSDKTLHPVNSFCRKSYCSRFIFLVQEVQYFEKLQNSTFKRNKTPYRQYRRF